MQLFSADTSGDDAMGLYATYVLPRIIDVAMRNEETRRLRAAAFAASRATRRSCFTGQ
jgi:hypothetical protein